MNNKIKTFEEIKELTQKLKKQNKTIAFAHGCFDVLHKGHLILLQGAKEKVDILIVGIDHDDNVRKMKGPTRPINTHDDRIEMLSHFDVVDYIFLIPPFKDINDSKFYTNLCKQFWFDFLVINSTNDRWADEKRSRVKTLNRKLLDITKPYDKSSTKIIQMLGV